MNKNISPKELIEILSPKIKKALLQTDIKNREDLEQELITMILTNLKKREDEKIPTFFEILEKEYHSD
ncbi:hypothetical protein PY093_03505 [Cytobacillus sp. S13-E01]|uniref:hypothetical protein n=1 Tax=Cytobacillus sp. S13-E01 TaxID=3031326 RepID=UPI0023D8599F|nr:hypothetical protein [Cytobacillus sp. S13-E01]MDF0725779.1 hypothetical protein [Cytobacillus sp. S13-E01]